MECIEDKFQINLDVKISLPGVSFEAVRYAGLEDIIRWSGIGWTMKKYKFLNTGSIFII